MAAQWVLPGILYDLSPHWIEADIANQLSHITVSLDENSLISALEQMPDPVISLRPDPVTNHLALCSPMNYIYCMNFEWDEVKQYEKTSHDN